MRTCSFLPLVFTVSWQLLLTLRGTNIKDDRSNSGLSFGMIKTGCLICNLPAFLKGSHPTLWHLFSLCCILFFPLVWEGTFSCNPRNSPSACNNSLIPTFMRCLLCSKHYMKYWNKWNNAMKFLQKYWAHNTYSNMSLSFHFPQNSCSETIIHILQLMKLKLRDVG